MINKMTDTFVKFIKHLKAQKLICTLKKNCLLVKKRINCLRWEFIEQSFLPSGIMLVFLAITLVQCAVMTLPHTCIFFSPELKITLTWSNLEISVYDSFSSHRISLSSSWIKHFLIFWDSQTHKGMATGNGLIRHLTRKMSGECRLRLMNPSALFTQKKLEKFC